MDNITEHFTWDEAACKDEYRTPVPDHLKGNVIEVATNMEMVREAIGAPIHVNR